MRFSQLLEGVAPVDRIDADPEIIALCVDSRDVTAGALFVAVPGYVTDGHQYIAQALRSGAAALLLQRDRVDAAHLPKGPLALVPDTRATLASVAAAFYGHPASHLRVIGVTGTDGKTTTCYLINAVLEEAGSETGLIGTVDFKIGGRWQQNDTRLTTPAAPEVQSLLAAIRGARAGYVILESTSHGLELRRLDCCEYDVAVFTNLTTDHLDQHGTVAAYRAAKGRLFEMLGEPSIKTGARYAVLNRDDPDFEYFRDRAAAQVVSYGFSTAADVRASDVELGGDATRLKVCATGVDFALELPLPGLFNVSNALAAITVGLREGIGPATIAEALSKFGGVPGRMERVDVGQPFGVIVDYAHTGEALRKVLDTLRPGVRGRIITVFGSAGERGGGTRRLHGRNGRGSAFGRPDVDHQRDDGDVTRRRTVRAGRLHGRARSTGRDW